MSALFHFSLGFATCGLLFLLRYLVQKKEVTEPVGDIEEKLLTLLDLAFDNQTKLKDHMAKSQERFDLLVARLDAVTSDIATDYATLLKAIQDGADSITEESFAKHEANIAALEALGASVDNPVPVPPPVTP